MVVYKLQNHKIDSSLFDLFALNTPANGITNLTAHVLDFNVNRVRLKRYTCMRGYRGGGVGWSDPPPTAVCNFFLLVDLPRALQQFGSAPEIPVRTPPPFWMYETPPSESWIRAWPSLVPKRHLAICWLCRKCTGTFSEWKLLSRHLYFTWSPSVIRIYWFPECRWRICSFSNSRGYVCTLLRQSTLAETFWKSMSQVDFSSLWVWLYNRSSIHYMAMGESYTFMCVCRAL